MYKSEGHCLNKKMIGMVFLGILFLGIFIKIVDIDQMGILLKNADKSLIFISGVIFVSAYFFRSLRWRILLLRIDKHIGCLSAFAVYMAGMVINYIIPIRLGELAKSIFLRKLHGVPVAISLPTVFVDKLMDLFPVMVLIGVMPFFPFEKSLFLQVVVYSLFVVFIVGIFVLILTVRHAALSEKLLKKCFFFLSGAYRERAFSFIERFVVGMEIIRAMTKWDMFRVVAISLLIIVLDALYLWLAFQAVGSAAEFYVIFLGYTLLNLTYIFPTPPAQLGSNELISLVIFTTLLGLDKNMVGIVMAYTHVMTGAIIVFSGYLALNFVGIGFKNWHDLEKDGDQ